MGDGHRPCYVPRRTYLICSYVVQPGRLMRVESQSVESTLVESKCANLIVRSSGGKGLSGAAEFVIRHETLLCDQYARLPMPAPSAGLR